MIIKIQHDLHIFLGKLRLTNKRFVADPKDSIFLKEKVHSEMLMLK
jgi:hypothetical protein